MPINAAQFSHMFQKNNAKPLEFETDPGRGTGEIRLFIRLQSFIASVGNDKFS
jgi:hypothetical protein